jgi:calcineurin-like phosphoesterase family protein
MQRIGREVMGQVFFTSDQHFSHSNIIRFCNRPFSDTEEMQEKLIANFNESVKPGDRTFHLGDMFWITTSVSLAVNIVKRLNGQHYYIFGNHDELFRHKELQSCFVWCKETENLKVQGYPNIWLSHYAHRVWNGSHKGSYHLFGHSHNELEDFGLSFDVGVDTNKFYPISLEDVDKKMKAKNIIEKKWKCINDLCGHSFTSTDSKSKICCKCTKEMRLVRGL